MIGKREILETASALGLLPNVVEKDCALGWLLAGIKTATSPPNRRGS